MTGRPVRKPVDVLTRRRFLQIGGTLSMGAVLAACIGGGATKRSPDSSGGAGGRKADATILRTLSSVEAVAIVVYTTTLDSGLLTTPAVADLAGVFRSHHREHAALFEGTTRDLGGAPFTDPNPIVMQQVKSSLDGLRDETAAVSLAFDVESFFPAKDRFQLAMRLNNLLASPSFAQWLEGDALDIGSCLWTKEGKPRVSIFSIAHLSDAERMFFVSLLLNQILGWTRAQSGTTSLRAIVYMDEIYGYFPPTAATVRPNSWPIASTE